MMRPNVVDVTSFIPRNDRRRRIGQSSFRADLTRSGYFGQTGTVRPRLSPPLRSGGTAP